MENNIEWYDVDHNTFVKLITTWVQLDESTRASYKFEKDSKHHVAYGEINDGEFGLLTVFDPDTNETTYYATLTALALAEEKAE